MRMLDRVPAASVSSSYARSSPACAVVNRYLPASCSQASLSASACTPSNPIQFNPIPVWFTQFGCSACSADTCFLCVSVLRGACKYCRFLTRVSMKQSLRLSVPQQGSACYWEAPACTRSVRQVFTADAASWANSA